MHGCRLEKGQCFPLMRLITETLVTLVVENPKIASLLLDHPATASVFVEGLSRCGEMELQACSRPACLRCAVITVLVLCPPGARQFLCPPGAYCQFDESCRQGRHAEA